MKILRVDYRLWLTGAILLLCMIALYSWALTQHPSHPNQQLIELRADADRKLTDYCKARDEYDQQFEAEVNGDWDNGDKIIKAREKLAPLLEKVSKLRDASDDAIEKTGMHINR
jgi:hypothetical protein